jgi:DNA primase
MSASSSNFNGIDGKTLVLQAVDLVQLISQTVKLTKRGGNYVGLCPFHNEKSGSFNVNPAKGFFHCFGCKESGNAIDFVMKRDRLEFKEALHLLADQYHIELPKGGGPREPAGLKQSLIDACAAATTFFEQQLAHPQIGAAARE